MFKHFLGDESVTMCGIAQEATHEYDIKAYTKPWHVALTTGTVSFSTKFSFSVTKIMVLF